MRGGRDGVGEELVEAVAEGVDGDLQIGNALVDLGFPSFEFILRRTHLRHRGLDLNHPLLVFLEHLENTLKLFIRLHGDLKAHLVIVRCQDRVSGTRCYHTSMTWIDSMATRWNWIRFFSGDGKTPTLPTLACSARLYSVGSNSSPCREVAYILMTLNQERKMGYAITRAVV